MYKNIRYLRNNNVYITVFWVLIIVLAVAGLSTYERLSNIYYRHNLLPAAALLDVFIVLFVFAHSKLVLFSSKCLFLYLLGVYVAISMLYLPPQIAGSPTIADVIVSYKVFVYVAMIMVVRPIRHGFGANEIAAIFRFLLVAFLLKYSIAWMFFDISRPGLFSENNFELPLIITLFVYLSKAGQLKEKKWLVLVILLVLISGSRSGILALLSALLVIYKPGSLRFAITAISGTLLLLLLVFVLDSRLGEFSNIKSIDRYYFMNLFLFEASQMDAWQYILGREPMTPLSPDTCYDLRFYRSLYSNVDYGICYPVILHVFYFRVILEHGLLGLAAIIYGFWIALRLRGFSRGVTFALISQGAINGLSVSGFGNTYFMLGLVLIIAGSGKRVINGTKNQY